MRNQVIRGGVLVIALAGWPAAPGFAQDAKATEILAATRDAVGNKKLDGMKSLTLQAKMQRNSGNFRAETEVEMLLEMPDKYLRSDTIGGGIGVMTTGFNGDKAIMPAGMRMAPGGGGMVMTMTMGGGATPHTAEGEKPTPEQLAQMNEASLRNYRTEISRFMLGWFGMAHPSLKAQYTYVGEAESPDGKAYVIDVKDADGFAARLFVDQNSKLPLMVTYQGRQPRMITSGSGPGMTRVTGSAGGGTVTMTPEQAQQRLEELKKSAAEAPTVEFSLFFEDWKEVDGINFPHTIRRA